MNILQRSLTLYSHISHSENMLGTELIMSG